MVGAIKIQTNSDIEPVRLELQKVREEHAKRQLIDFSHVFRKKSRMEMIRLSCIIVGIEFAYAAETAFVSPILLEIGVEHQQMPLVWGLSPILGFLLAPFLGTLSDRCRMRFGRRRPFIVLLSFGILCGLLLVPHGKDIGQLLGDNPTFGIDNKTFIEYNEENGVSYNVIKNTSSNFRLWAIIITICGVILLDFDADCCQSPARAYLVDVCVPEEHSKSLSTFSILAGLGGCIGYAIGGVNWNEIGIGELLGGNIKTVFIIVTIVFVISVCLTITSFREVPLPLLEKDELLRPVTEGDVRKELEKNNYIRVGRCCNNNNNNHNNYNNNNNKDPVKIISVSNDEDEDDEEEKEIVTLTQYLKSIIFMPKSLRYLCLSSLFAWMGHLCYCLYFTSFVGEAVFHGNPMAETGSLEYKLFEEGVRFGCIGMSVYALSCSIYSLAIELLLKIFQTKYVYTAGLLIYTIGMAFLSYFPSKISVILCSTTAGILYGTLFTIPYLLIAQYHAKNSFKVKKGVTIELKRKRGLGTDIAVISSTIFVAQIIISFSIGGFITLIGSTLAVIYAAGFFSLCGAITAQFVLYFDN